jgi:hypothetical protein
MRRLFQLLRSRGSARGYRSARPRPRPSPQVPEDRTVPAAFSSIASNFYSTKKLFSAMITSLDSVARVTYVCDKKYQGPSQPPPADSARGGVSLPARASRQHTAAVTKPGTFSSPPTGKAALAVLSTLPAACGPGPRPGSVSLCPKADLPVSSFPSDTKQPALSRPRGAA